MRTMNESIIITSHEANSTPSDYHWEQFQQTVQMVNILKVVNDVEKELYSDRGRTKSSI